MFPRGQTDRRVTKASASVGAIQMNEHGGADRLVWSHVNLPPPGPGEVQIRHTAIGVNFVDINHRKGTYPIDLPAIPGREAAGIVTAVGRGVRNLLPGQRVAYCLPPGGAYCEARNYPAAFLVPLPDSITDVQAAAMMLKGLTAACLLLYAHRIKRGETILIHAAAGGVGAIACQWAKSLGAIVIGTVGSDEKAAFARAHGCDHAIVYTRENIVDRVREITGGRMVSTVYDSIGRDTLLSSIDCLRRQGTLVWFGVASGRPQSLDPNLLAKASLTMTWAALVDHVKTRGALLRTARALFDVVASGAVRVDIGGRYALKDAAEAQRDMEARRVMGSLVLIP